MTRDEILARMDEAAREDRERFFVVADAMTFQPKYRERTGDVEAVRQQWRDMTLLPDYPQIKWPMELPEWFPPVRFASSWDVDYLEKTLAEAVEQADALPGDGAAG